MARRGSLTIDGGRLRSGFVPATILSKKHAQRSKGMRPTSLNTIFIAAAAIAAAAAAAQAGERVERPAAIASRGGATVLAERAARKDITKLVAASVAATSPKDAKTFKLASLRRSGASRTDGVSYGHWIVTAAWTATYKDGGKTKSACFDTWTHVAKAEDAKKGGPAMISRRIVSACDGSVARVFDGGFGNASDPLFEAEARRLLSIDRPTQ
jgi:hypothetical protein